MTFLYQLQIYRYQLGKNHSVNWQILIDIINIQCNVSIQVTVLFNKHDLARDETLFKSSGHSTKNMLQVINILFEKVDDISVFLEYKQIKQRKVLRFQKKTQFKRFIYLSNIFWRNINYTLYIFISCLPCVPRSKERDFNCYFFTLFISYRQLYFTHRLY